MAITDLIVSGFEGSEPQFTSSTSNWSVITAAARTASLGGRATGAAGSSCFGQQTMTANNQVVVRFYWRYPSALPSGGTTDSAFVCSIREAAAGVFQMFFRPSDSKLIARIGGGTVAVNVDQVGPTISDLEWHLIELQAQHSTGTPTLDWRIDGNAQTQVVASGAATNMDAMRLGDGNTTNTPARTEDYDDVSVGAWTVAGTDWYGPYTQTVIGPAFNAIPFMGGVL